MAIQTGVQKKTTPLKAIRAMCVECMGGANEQDCKELIRDCTSTDCPLHDFRLGSNPYNQHPGCVNNFLPPLN